ncbi:MAG: undecaprenyl-diphosphate phosphatase [Methanosphaera sp.]|nr:undecaprenyl-diphosphate phosphatase [Methanosphaera sp.]
MLDIISAIILGAVQGLSEFLPISSSGHLALVQYILGVDTGLVFDTVLHIGTLVAVFTFFWNDIVNIIKGFILSIIDLTESRQLFIDEIRDNKYKRMPWLIIIGTIPVGITGLFLKDYIETIFRGALPIGVFLIITGILLYVSERYPTGDTTSEDISFKQALIVGIGQGCAIFPGLSRSGTTIATGLFSGLNREFAARFSFLLSIPAILGAGVVQIKDIATIDISMSVMLAGFISSVIFGYFAIKVLMKIIEEWSLDVFAYYCWIVGILTIVLTFIL